MISRVGIIGVALCIAISGTKAATISVEIPNGLESARVTIFGEIGPGDYEQFRQKVARIPKAAISNVNVALTGPGGSVVEAISIGREIRMKNFSTLVIDNYRCASACALAWLGGTRRFMQANAKIGFHAASDSTTGQESGEANALVGAYLNEINLPYSAVLYITHAPPNSITWLSRTDAERVGIKVSVLDEQPARPLVQGTSPHFYQPSPGFYPPGQERQAAAPQRAPQNLRERANEFITALYRITSGPNAELGNALRNFYAETVQYYGEAKSREQAMAQALAFAARWEVRQYKPKEGTVTIKCENSSLICYVNGILEFDAQSFVRHKHSTGEATFAYVLRFIPDQWTPQIIAEDGKILKRDVSALPAQPYASMSTDGITGRATVRNSYAVKNNLSDGILNMRSGPGQNHPIVAVIPAGTRGLKLEMCRDPDDGRSRYEWCQVTWEGNSGWVSSGGLVEETAKN